MLTTRLSFWCLEWGILPFGFREEECWAVGLGGIFWVLKRPAIFRLPVTTTFQCENLLLPRCAPRTPTLVLNTVILGSSLYFHVFIWKIGSTIWEQVHTGDSSNPDLTNTTHSYHWNKDEGYDGNQNEPRARQITCFKSLYGLALQTVSLYQTPWALGPDRPCSWVVPHTGHQQA